MCRFIYDCAIFMKIIVLSNLLIIDIYKGNCMDQLNIDTTMDYQKIITSLGIALFLIALSFYKRQKNY